MKKFLFAFLLLFLAAPALAYTVQKGDTPYGIWGSNWKTELQAYGISDPHKLPVGLEVQKEQLLGGVVPNSDALIDTYLVSGIASTDNTMTLASGVTRAGVSLSGTYCFTLDVNTPVIEYACGTATGATITNLSRGVDLTNPNTTSSALAFPHRRFASVQVTDFPAIQFITRKINGVDPLPNPLVYDTTTALALNSTNTNALASINYVNSTTVSGAPNIGTTVKGIGQEATAAQIQASTAVGSTGADLLVPASLTAQTSTANKIPVANGQGVIDTNYINTSTLLTTIASSTPTASLLPIYKANGQLSVSSTPVSSTDAVSLGYFNSVSSTLPYESTFFTVTSSVSRDNTSLNTSQILVSTTIPTSTLSANGAIRITIYGSFTVGGAGLSATVTTTLGATTLQTLSLGTSTSGSGKIEILVSGAGTSTSEVSTAVAMMSPQLSVSQTTPAENVNTGIPLVIAFKASATGGGASFTINQMTIEKLK